MRYDFVLVGDEESVSHAYLRVQFRSGMFVADYRQALERIENAYNRLEFMESQAIRLSERIGSDLPGAPERIDRSYLIDLFRAERRRRATHDSEELYGLYDLLIFDILRRDERPTETPRPSYRDYLEAKLSAIPEGYRPEPARALILDAASIRSPGFNDFLGVGRLVESLVRATAKNKLDRANASKAEAESRVLDAKARKTDAECAVVRAKAMKEQATALTEWFKALTKAGYSREEAQEFIARQLMAAGDEITASLDSGQIGDISALPYPKKRPKKTEDDEPGDD